MEKINVEPVSSPPQRSHHDIAPHSHVDGYCPLNGKSFGWCPKQDGDCRSSCPALNALANHGYINRDGKHIDLSDLVTAVSQVYGCSHMLSYLLVHGGQYLLGQYRSISLEDISRHNLIEHNASLTKDDADGEEYGPDKVDSPLLTKLLKDSRSRAYLDSNDLSLARVRRENTCRHAIDHIHQGIARGEMALILNVFGQTRATHSKYQQIPLDVAKIWFHDERLPDGWKPSHTVGVVDLLRDISLIHSTMEYMRKHWDKFGKLATYLETSSDKSPLSLNDFKDMESIIEKNGSSKLADVFSGDAVSPPPLSSSSPELPKDHTPGTFKPSEAPTTTRSDSIFSIASTITLVDDHEYESGKSNLKPDTPGPGSHSSLLHKLGTLPESLATAASTLRTHI